MQGRMSIRTIQRGSRKIGNHIQFTSAPTKSTSATRRSVFFIRRLRASASPLPEAARTCVSAIENPAARMKAGATSPSIHCRALNSVPPRSSGRNTTA